MKTIPLNKGYVVLVDDADYDLVASYRWTAARNKYGTIYAQTEVELDEWIETPGKRDARRRKRHTIRMHRLIMSATDPKVEVDHEDHNGLNNQRFNLRKCKHARNQQNRQKPARPTSSKYKGVSLRKDRGKWRAEIMVDGKQIVLGLHADEDAAARAYDTAARKYFGEFAHLNFPET